MGGWVLNTVPTHHVCFGWSSATYQHFLPPTQEPIPGGVTHAQLGLTTSGRRGLALVWGRAERLWVTQIFILIA